MTAEVTFAKNFLALLDSKPVKLQADYAADQKTVQPRGALTLPRMSQAMQAPDQPGKAAEGDSTTTIIIKSSRNPPVNIQLDAQPLNMSILELKQKVATEVKIDGTDKIRLLYNKKPCSDSKSIKDVVGEATPTTEFSVMFMGVTPGQSSGELTGKTTEADNAASKAETVAPEIIETEAFWKDLEGYLQQKLDNKSTAQRAAKIFKEAWSAKR